MAPARMPRYSGAMRRIRGLKSLIHDAVDSTVDLVELGHESTSRTVLRALALVEPLTAPARQIDGVRRLFTAGVLGTIKGVNHLIAAVTDAGLDAFAPDTPAEAPLALRSDMVGTAAWAVDTAIGTVNGVVGDHLSLRANGLDLRLALRGLDAWIEPDGAGVPADAGPRVVVMVHGLAATEWSWCMDAARSLGDAGANFGTLLHDERGYTPLYLRYNSGRHISDNGRLLADRLEALVATWPVPVEELLLIGHSMGGLVVRSAVHIAFLEGQRWVSRVRSVVTLASPHQGAPLEKFGNLATAVLGAIDLPGTAIPARLINGRSAGIKDLRYGYVRDADWRGGDPDALAENRAREAELPAHIAWCFISATVGETPGHPASRTLGDLLVRVQSASGPRDPPARAVRRHVGGVHHVAIQSHPQVYAIVRDFIDAQRDRASATA